MASEFLAGFQPGAAYAPCRSAVDSGRLLAPSDRPSPHWRHGVYVGRPLRLVASATFVFPHRVADCAALGFASPRIRSAGSAFADSDYWRPARHFTISTSSAQYELCVSGSLTAPRLGTCTDTSRDYPRGMPPSARPARASARAVCNI